MSRLTFYRKYRSQNFNEICGQNHIVETLKNAITNKRLSHAYIFSGPRGTGKTSIARIFAKAVNTFQEEDQFDNLDNPICTRITKGLCVDIVEIDAASNTGVDNIRDLNDKVNFAPVECKTKFYIIDEAHMLSTGAFNALLKTLEEPPSHTIFVLATTEPHKIPITIHSRCQHLRFRNLTEDEITIQLKHICEQENITISEEGLSIISQNSSGCMRDALSLFDQIYSFKGNTINDNDILDILGASKSDQIFSLYEAIFKKNKEEVHSILSDIFAAGINPYQLIHDSIQVGKSILAKQCNNDGSIKIHKEKVNTLAELSTLTESTKLLETLAKIESETRWFSNPELLIQIRLLQLITENEQANLVFAKTEVKKDITPTPQVQLKQQEPTPSKKASFTMPTPTPTSNPIEKPTQPIKNPIQQQSPIQPSPKIEKPKVPVAQTNSLTEVNNGWEKVLEKIRQDKPATFSMIRNSKVVQFETNCLTIKLAQSFGFFFEKLNESSQINLLKSYIKTIFEQDLNIKFDDQNNSKDEIIEENTQETFSNQNNEPVKKESESINNIVSMFDGSVL
ncbi:MAG: hypothetical protein CMP39_03780 [Rickettsiales bacterium]|nr:hypothetical protein [Rickettsiales bacterium]